MKSLFRSFMKRRDGSLQDLKSAGKISSHLNRAEMFVFLLFSVGRVVMHILPIVVLIELLVRDLLPPWPIVPPTAAALFLAGFFASRWLEKKQMAYLFTTRWAKQNRDSMCGSGEA